MSSRLLIAGGTVVDPANGVHASCDVLVLDGEIVEVAAPGHGAGSGVDLLDATGCLVVPGLIDMHVHLREPGYEYKETIETGSRAAAVGGFTAVACMANTNPVNDSAAVTETIIEKARAANLVRVYPIGAVTMGLQGEQLAEIGEMRRAGIVAVSDDGQPIMSGELMRRALEYAGMFGIPVIAHEEDRGIACGGVMHEGAVSLRLGLKGVPSAAETVMVARDIALAEQTGGRVHIAHVSAAGSVELIRSAKARGIAVTGEASPHHFTLTDAAVDGYNTNAKMNPPLRCESDVAAVRAGIRDGTLDVIASDHAPHHRDEKDVEFDAALNGIVGLETALPLALRLIAEADIPIDTLIRAMSTNPARILGVPGGSLSVGAPADIAIIDPKRRWRVDPAVFASKSRNTPFGGWEMEGQAVATIVGGRVVHRATISGRRRKSA
ncbi:MAG TPA: dihydroorotase [Candidatus Binatia bacterium]|nr:dihydroorotase [Candidatus Binatia bacterium]